MAKGTFTPSTVVTNNITALPSVVVGQAVTLQPLFDKGTLDTKTFINSTLIAELNGDDGANKIGCNPSNLASDNVKEALEELQTNIQNTSVGAIPDNSLTDIKLSNTAGQIKARVATAETEINDLQADVGFVKSDNVYSLATIASRQIRITKTGTLPTTNFKISAAIAVGAQLTISLDAGATSLPLVDASLAAITSIESGVHQVIFDTTRYILNPFGQVREKLNTTTFNSHLTEVTSELISFERDVSIAGDQIISGFSRKPKTLIINAVVTGSLKQSKGQLSTNGQRVLYTIGNNGQFLSANNLSITINDTAGNETRGVVVINANNTITVTWTKLGTGGTGTARINVTAFYHGED